MRHSRKKDELKKYIEDNKNEIQKSPDRDCRCARNIGENSEKMVYGIESSYTKIELFRSINLPHQTVGNDAAVVL